MSERPTSRTSHYGWALWHLAQAEDASSIEGSNYHAIAAQAHATLAQVVELGAARGVDPTGPTTWEADQ